MTTKTDTLTTARRLTIVKHLATGKDLDTVAALTNLDRSTVLDVASHLGYPSAELLQRAVGLLEQKIERDNAPTIHPHAAEIERQQRAATRPAVGASTPPAAGTSTASPVELLTRPDEIRVLINTAKGHPSKRIQAAGDRVIDAVDRLKTLIHEDQEKHAERRRLAEERAAARAEVERLEAQLRAARAKLKSKAQRPGGRAAAASGQLASVRGGGLVTAEDLAERGVSSKQVRAWAHEHDVECPDTGRLPSRVLTAYDDAHESAAS